MSTPQRLPIVNSDDGTWGDIIRQYLKKEHYDTGVDNPANGGHQNITIQPGTAALGTAPLKFTSGTLLTTPEAGAVEFNTDSLYFTITTGTVRKKIAIYDDTSGATGDMYYRDSSGNFVRLGIGSTGQALKVSGGLPAWGSAGSATFATGSKTTSYTMTTTDTVILVNAASNNVVITLPVASGVTGYRFYIKRVDSATNTVTVNRSGSDTIDGATNFGLSGQYSTAEVVSDGSNWYILSGTALSTTTATSTIAFRSVANVVQASAASAVCSKPTGTAAGDVMIAYFIVYDGASEVLTPPSGWTAIGSIASFTTTHKTFSQAFYKVAGASEPTTYTFASTPANACDVAIMSYTGVNNTNPIDGHSENAGSGTTRTGLSVTTTIASDMLLFLSAGYNNAITSGPSGYTSRTTWDVSDATYELALTTAGATTAATATQVTDTWTVNMVALQPAVATTTIFNNPVQFNGTVDIEGNTTVDGTITMTNGLTVSAGGATIAGGANVTGALAVTGSETISINLSVTGAVNPGNDTWANPSITPVANTPTSTTVTYSALAGTGSIYAEVTANTTLIGSTVMGVAASSVTSTSSLAWIYRTNTTGTGIYIHIHRDIS